MSCTPHDPNATSPDLLVRSARAETLARALAETDPNEAAALAAAFLDSVELQLPWPDPFGDVDAEAHLWATAAPVHQLVALTCAALRELGRNAIPINLRKQVIVLLWDGLRDDQKRAFLHRVDPQGRFIRKEPADAA